MIRIMTDSSANISQEEAKKLGIDVIPMTVMFGGEQFRDGVDIDETRFYQKLVSSREFPHTSQLTEGVLEEYFGKASKEGDGVLFLPLASSLSGTCALAQKVAERFPKVTVHNCGATTAILRILVEEAVKNADKPVGEVVAMLDDLRPRIKLYAALDTLEYLQKGGRLARSSALIGEFLKVKPIITLGAQGEVGLLAKTFGMHLALRNLAGRVDAARIDGDKPLYFLYTMDDGNCNAMAERLRLSENLLKNAQKINICPVIGSHIGPKAAGIVFVEKAGGKKGK